ncbi:MAG: IS1595 family transposase [Desulfobulbus sp.]
MRMKHKLQQTMKNRDDQYRLAGNILMDDAYWGGKKGDGKRGRGATGKMPFVAALSLTEEGFPLFIKFNQVQQFTLKEISAWSVKYIRLGSSVLTDGLGGFPGVADAGCAHDKVTTYVDGRYTNGDMFKWLNIVLGNVKNAHCMAPTMQ